MALAYLCSKIRPTDCWFKVADHPVSSPYAIIIDHGLREGSDVEASNVSRLLMEKLKIKSSVIKLRWDPFLPYKGANPNELPNIETLARYLRYRAIGNMCRTQHISSLFTAHHQDDQYETVLMRVLSGHGYRGLQGMRPSTDIPECYDLHGVYRSGLVDDQRRRHPFYVLRPTGKERKKMRKEMKDMIDPEVFAQELEEGLRADMAGIDAYLDEQDPVVKDVERVPPLTPMEFENGGVMVYRPLLGFSKDRLIATCLENDIPWFEDHTNADPTLTMRNAVRHMYKNYTLPVALQKPSILSLAKRCRDRVIREEAEAARTLRNAHIHLFEPNTGTLVITFPKFSFPGVPRRSASSPAARQRRVAHYRLIAGLMLRKLLSMVTPERELSQVAQLDHLINMIFPDLVEEGIRPPDPKPYVICGVHFVPLEGRGPIRWQLTRAPYVSHAPRPQIEFKKRPLRQRVGKHPSEWGWSVWTQAQLFDGRYWVRIRHRFPCPVRVAPFEMEHQKPFREALGEEQKKELASKLKKHAPGKIRYTLPAIYAAIDVTELINGGGWWPEWDNVQAQLKYKAQMEARKLEVERSSVQMQQQNQYEKREPTSSNPAADGAQAPVDKIIVTESAIPEAGQRFGLLSEPAAKVSKTAIPITNQTGQLTPATSPPQPIDSPTPTNSNQISTAEPKETSSTSTASQTAIIPYNEPTPLVPIDPFAKPVLHIVPTRPRRLSDWEQELLATSTPKLLALPTLSIAIPGVEKWLEWEVMYKKVDDDLLRLSEEGERDDWKTRRAVRREMINRYRNRARIMKRRPKETAMMKKEKETKKDELDGGLVPKFWGMTLYG